MDTLLQYKCPSCGGSLTFDSDTQNMKCPYCDSELDVEALKALDAALSQTPEDSMDWQQEGGSQWQEGEQETLLRYVCQSCGGEIVTDETTSATSCPYCASPVVMTRQLAGALRPDLVIPFQLDRKAAEAALRKHLQGKVLLPKPFKKENHIREVKGVYVPFWLFDSHAQGSARYHATRVRTWSGSRYIYTETTHYSVHRSGTLDFAGVPVDGSSKMEDALMESLEPYDLTQAVPFQTAYLAGYLADKYDVDSQESAQRANQRIRNSTDDALRQTVMGYTTVVPEACNVQLKDNRVRYALYPVWLLTTRYRGQNYQFAVNGQTGKPVGDLPVDWGKFWRLWALISAGASVAACLAYWLFF